MLLVTVATRTFPRFLISLGVMMAAASPAAAQLRPATVSVALTATVPATLRIVSVTPISRDTSGGFEIVRTRVSVRGNVPHRLEVQSATTQPSDVRIRNGEWTLLSRDRSVTAARTDMTGETSHLVICRTPAPRAESDAGSGGCGLSFTIVSTDTQFPAHSDVFVAAR